MSEDKISVSIEGSDAYAYFISLLEQHFDGIKIEESDPLSSFGIDSLSLLNISSSVEEKYGIDIIPYLAESTTVKDIKKVFLSGGGVKTGLTLWKIKRSEIRRAAGLYADCMVDYPLVRELYGETKSVKQCALLEGMYLIYAGLGYHYSDGGRTVLFGLKTPKDKDRPTVPLFLNPVYSVHFLRYFTPHIIKKIKEYTAFEKSLLDRHIDREKDSYIPIAAVAKEYRSSGVFFRLLRSLRTPGEIWFLTNSERDRELYLSLGAELVEESEIFGTPVCLMLYRG